MTWGLRVNGQSGKFVECHWEGEGGGAYSADSANSMGIRTKPDSEETWQKRSCSIQYFDFGQNILFGATSSVDFHQNK